MRRIRDFIFKKNQSPENNRKKVGRLLFAATIGLFFLFAARLCYVVATDSVAHVNLGKKTQELYQGSAEVPSKRGGIYDRDGEIIAKDATSYSIYVVLDKNYVGINNVKLYAEESDYPKLAKILQEQLGISESYSLSQMGLKKIDGVEVKQVEFGLNGKNINLEKKLAIEAAVKAAQTKGLYFTEHPMRLYPNGNFASYLIGTVAPSDENDESQGLKGIMGLEAVYNQLLKGSNGKTIYERDHNGNPVPGTVEEVATAEDGEDIYTTLDTHLQSYLETLMDQIYEKSKPEDLTAVLMKAKTGEILAMSQRPTFDPQKGFDKDTLYRNILVEDPYEPGSTMKTMILAAAINEGKFNPYETYNNQVLNLYDAKIYDHDFGKIGTLNMSQAYSWSSNIGMAILEQHLGDKLWLEYLQRFGFGKVTNPDFRLETTGSLPEDNQVSVAMSSFGQAVSVSAMQMLQAYSVITNGGQMLKPYYISKTVNHKTGEVEVRQPENLGEVVTAETAKEVLKHMEDVVYDPEYGTGTQYAIDGYRVGAKTGTAQISENGKYLAGEHTYIYSVMMTAPADDPEYLLYVTIKKPEIYSGKLLSELTNPLMKRALDLKESPVEDNGVVVENYEKQEVSKVKEALEAAGLEGVVVGNGDKVVKQSIKSDTSLLPGSKVILLTNGNPVMPDVTGWSKNDVENLASLLDKKFTIEGQGFVVAQSLAAGSEVTDEEIRIVLQ